MRNIFKKIVGFITILFVILSVLIILMPLIGIEPTVMLTGSMKPVIPVGSVCFVDKNYSYDKLKENDIIAYQTPKYIVIHRIIEKNDKGYRTKGDHNKKADVKTITKDIYYGKLVFAVPYLGYVATNLQNKYGKFLLIAFIVFVVVVNYYLNRKEE